ncbi:MAG: GNAT family N-acetyltransferase [Ectothiorhodospiraceae bacterium]|nr:GNAT family N-acetyltransferase [Ectothiorhodospiraceae bacterium]MCH8505385.1 GNAT family N-acetyltransferase [Ectothiorhodospiraceae bacterium]
MNGEGIRIRTFRPDDWPAVWAVIEPVLRAGETYPLDPAISEADARRAWIETPAATFVATLPGSGLAGTYYIKPNQPTLGAHVCNCGYIVSETARGEGVASAMCEHSQRQAVSMGFRAMQYNLVVSTNTAAFRLWQRHGFQLVGTLPGAFRHPTAGYVDAHVMYKQLQRQGNARINQRFPG